MIKEEKRKVEIILCNTIKDCVTESVATSLSKAAKKVFI